MTYTVLARKYRPRSFDTLVGQDHVVRTLKNAIANERLHHAYFFTGTRGVGKTSIGRIIAKCLNCEKGISANPCENCSSCLEIDAGRSLDLIEIDAASNTKVEDTRELLNNVQYAPTRDRFKIYLIDEVHMLSGHSFNALLKTLEEPPSHVKFILATTDPQKLPITILSRCLQFHLKNMLPEIIVQQLQLVCSQEKVPAEILALKLLSEAADGSMRDALSLLDQALAYGNNQVLLVDVETMLGSVKKTALFNLVENLGHKNGLNLLQALEALILQGGDCQALLETLLSFLHQLLLIKIVPQSLDADPIYAEKCKALSLLFKEEELQSLYQMGVQGRRDLPWAPSARIGLEMILLRMLTKMDCKAQTIVPQTERTPSSSPLTGGGPSLANKNTSEQTRPSETMPTKTTQESNQISTSSQRTLGSSPAIEKLDPSVRWDDKAPINWSSLLPQLNLTGLTLSLAENCALKNFTENKIELEIDAAHLALGHDSQRKRLEEKLSQHFNKNMSVDIQVGSVNISPAQEKKKVQEVETQNRLQKIEEDPIAQELIKAFSAKIQ
jgi:DNA polymerase-3 subunit gamma/tau